MAKPSRKSIGKIGRLEAKVAELEAHGSHLRGDPAHEKKMSTAYANLARERGIALEKSASLQLESAREIEARKESMAVTVHDLKVPITVSLLNLELAGMEPDDEEKQNYLIAVRRELEFLLDTISNLLDLEQRENIQIVRQQVELRELLDGILERMSVIISDKPNLTLRNKISAKFPTIQADRHKLTRVFNNLLSNAIKYTDAGSITIAATHSKKNNSVSVTVEDTGHGIEPDRLPQLFQMFQGDAKRLDSSGVGLAFVKMTVEAHGGSVGIESKRGKGTVVGLVLPVGR